MQEFIQRLKAEVERQHRLRVAMMKLTLIAEFSQTTAFSQMSGEKYDLKVCNN
jgi:hypothetical protein